MKKQFFRDAQSGKIMQGKAPQNHPCNNHDTLNYKIPTKGRYVKFLKHGDKESSGGKVLASGKDGVLVQDKHGKKHQVLHHEVTGTVVGKNTHFFIKKAMINSQVAKQYLPALEASISLCEGAGSYNSTDLNTHKYRLEALRNKIQGGSSVNSKDLEDAKMTMKTVGELIRKMGKK